MSHENRGKFACAMQENEISNSKPIEVEVSIMDCKECKHLIGLGVAQMNTVSGKLITIPCIFFNANETGIIH